MAKRFISFSVSILFILWILPLGVFVQANQEKKFCGGQRAICLCKHLIDKRMAQNAGKMFLKSTASAPEKESSSASSPYFLLPNIDSMHRTDKALALSDETMFYSFLAVSAIDHVPKRFLI